MNHVERQTLAMAQRALALLAVAAAALFAQDRVALEGRVLDTTGAPIPDATIFVRDLGTGLETAQSVDFRGGFVVDVRPGRFLLTAAVNEFQTAAETVDLEYGSAEPVVLTLAPAILTQSIVVTGSREEELREETVAQVAVIARTELRDSGYESVTDVLSEEPGVVTRTSRSPGSRAGTQIHGVDSRQSLILIDGFPVVGARGVKSGILNMNRQSTNRLDRVEIVKGASSALYGSDAIGGVINMITRQPRERFDANVTASTGTFGAVDLRADAGFVHEGWSGFLAAERHKRNPYDLTPQNFDTTGPGFRRYDYMAKINRDFSENLKLSLLANAFDNREVSVYAGTGGGQSTTTNDSAQNYGLTLNSGLSARTQLQARAYYGKYDEAPQSMSTPSRERSTPPRISTSACIALTRAFRTCWGVASCSRAGWIGSATSTAASTACWVTTAGSPSAWRMLGSKTASRPTPGSA